VVHEPNVSDRPHLATADPRYSAEVSEENVDLACRISAALAGGFEAVEPFIAPDLVWQLGLMTQLGLMGG
jgi:hypothetical protein